MNIKKGDKIIVISGKDKGKQGKVIRVFPEDMRVIVENVNLKKKHQRPKAAGKKGEKIEVARPMPVSNVALICKSCGKRTRISSKVISGKKIRMCKKCGSEA